MTRLVSKDFLSGLLFAGLGALCLMLAGDLQIGSASRMGPGYFPRLLAFGMFAVGAVLVIRAFLGRGGDAVQRGRFRPLATIIGAIVLFALLAETAGMAIAGMVLVLVSAAAGYSYHWREALIAAVALTVFAIAVFIWGLGLPIPVWPL